MKLDELPWLQTIQAAARRAGTNGDMIENAIAKGELDARKLGRRTMVVTASFMKWLEDLPAAQLTARRPRRAKAEVTGSSQDAA